MEQKKAVGKASSLTVCNSDVGLTVLSDEDTVGKVVAEEILAAMEEAIEARGRFVLGCPGGRTPRSTYHALGAEFMRRDTDLSQLVIVMMDDYVQATEAGWRHVDERAHYSCRRFAVEEIQSVFNAGVSPTHALRDEDIYLPNPENPEAFEELLARFGGVDFFILASGAGDGHVAFNPPGTSENARTRVVELALQTRMDNLATFPDFGGIEEVPTHGVTVGTGTITEFSRKAAMIVIGPDKANAVERLATAGTYEPSWPATVFRTIPGTRLYVDAAAARGFASRDAPERNVP